MQYGITSISIEPLSIRGLKRYQLVARTKWRPEPGFTHISKTVSVVGDWREGYTTKSQALIDAKQLRQMVRDGASHWELCTCNLTSVGL
jgi:hypothetical protein